MAEYQINFIDRRLMYIEEMIKNWEPTIKLLMENPDIMKELKKRKKDD
jgi:hypothetical protein|tara:strand:- start:279 stop:422 length:144 start_codon:yes stop_codon:yes gene_type:complete